MRIVIDMQGAQSSGSRNRGIGRYTLALSKEMVRLRGKHEVILVLNGLFRDTIEPIRATFAALLPKENIRVWEAVGPVNADDQSNDVRRQAAELILEAFLANLRPDIVLNTSLFEGLVDDAITSIGHFTSQLPSAVILYDLIPLIHKSIYLQNPVIERWYLNKLGHVRRADLLLSISASSGQEAVDYLGFTPKQVVNISTACDTHFQPMVVDETKRTHFHQDYGLIRPFVMYTGGIDHRKNIEGLIRAYASLPKYIRATHQLAVVCSIQAPDRERLRILAKKEGLAEDELVITGFVSEEDLLALYNLCKLFVFPSWHEGFGLPALEAMACGRAVIGANTSSVPEVIGRKDALFDPLDDAAIKSKIEEILTNDDFCAELERDGLVQAKKFSWEKTACRAWEALEAFVSDQKPVASITNLKAMPQRQRLAYISPLPPEQSGIGDYSAELLPELARLYEIDVIIAQKEVSDAWIRANCTIHDVAWFRQNAHRFDRVLYHFGNSHYHSYMFDLLNEFPGVVVLHDFYLSGIVYHMDVHGIQSHGWTRALMYAHGWPAVLARYQAKDSDNVIWTYPCNLEVLQQALGMIVHSDYSRRLACEWYGEDAAEDWSMIPLLRAPAIKTDRCTARRELDLAEDDFVVCSFGLLGPHKLNHRLLSAWLASPLVNDPRCRLVFVGQNHSGDYGADLMRTLNGSVAASRIEITSWTDAERYRTWLAAADIGVQLRTLSRGETSAAVLDCMNNGLATIVNANGSMADLSAEAVWMLPDEFSDKQLTEALTMLWRDVKRRIALGQRALEFIRTYHQPRACAEQYAQAIESFYHRTSQGLPALIDALAEFKPLLPDEDWLRVAVALANDFSPKPRRKQLLIDISTLVQCDAKSGIQRVVRALLLHLLMSPPEGWAVEPVFATSDAPGYQYARQFTSHFLGVDYDWAEDAPVDAWQGDIFLGLDLQPVVVPTQKDHLLSWHRRGVEVFFVVYDLLPVLLPHACPDGAQAVHQRWLETISHFDGAVCISRTVADEFHDWLQMMGPKRERPFVLSWFHLGADVENSVPTAGMPANADQVFSALNTRPSFLMVGTVEPRKAHAQALAAFEQLWREDIDVNLVIIGKQGWKVDALVMKLGGHPEFGKRLFWLDGVSDEYLDRIYVASTCLIAASEGEGFGLPLIEAAQHNLSIIARDIPVFREVAGEHAFYFNGESPEQLAGAVKTWLSLDSEGKAPVVSGMEWLTWAESTEQLIQNVCKKN
jgi:glycosyltransferase involved in cell wall biosynthesis